MNAELVKPLGDVSFLQKDRVRRILALRYNIETEVFDRTLPGAWFRPDEWLPYPGEPRARSIAFARRVRSEVEREAEENEISKVQLHAEIQALVGLRLDVQQAELKALMDP
jgi:hypothetical protein